MTKKENLLSLLKRQGYENVPVDFSLCPHLIQTFKEKYGNDLDYTDYFEMPWKNIDDLILKDTDRVKYRKYYSNLKEGAVIISFFNISSVSTREIEVCFFHV